MSVLPKVRFFAIVVFCCPNPSLPTTHSQGSSSQQHEIRAYIVALKANTPPGIKENLLEELRSRDASISEPLFLAKIGRILQLTLNGFIANLSDTAVRHVKSNLAVQTVEEDQTVRAGHTVRNYSNQGDTYWGLDRLDQLNLPLDQLYRPSCNLTGRGVDVYVLDSGINYSHAEFEGRAMYPGFDPVDQRTGLGFPFLGWDCHGHGTHVSSIIGGKTLGVASNCTLFSVRVLTCANEGTVSLLIEGLEGVLEHHQSRKPRRAVVNISIFGRRTQDRCLRTAILQVIRSGIPVVTIAGNGFGMTGSACWHLPAYIKKAITVGASRMDDQVWPGSYIGSCIQLMAPGERIWGATNQDNIGGTTRSGTSMAAPFVAGAAVLLLERCPNLSAHRVGRIILKRLTVSGKLSFDLMNAGNITRRLIRNTPNLLLNFNNMCPNGKWSFSC